MNVQKSQPLSKIPIDNQPMKIPNKTQTLPKKIKNSSEKKKIKGLMTTIHL